MGERTDDAGQIIGVLYGIQDELQMIRDLLTDIKKILSEKEDVCA